MFALALMMVAAHPMLAPAAAVVAPPPVRRTVSAHRARRVPLKKARLVPVRMNILAPCDINPSRLGCRASENERYRLRGLPTDRPVDMKTHAIEIDNKKHECGVIGAEICPAKGAQILKVDLNPPAPGE